MSMHWISPDRWHFFFSFHHFPILSHFLKINTFIVETQKILAHAAQTQELCGVIPRRGVRKHGGFCEDELSGLPQQCWGWNGIRGCSVNYSTKCKCWGRHLNPESELNVSAFLPDRPSAVTWTGCSGDDALPQVSTHTLSISSVGVGIRAAIVQRFQAFLLLIAAVWGPSEAGSAHSFSSNRGIPGYLCVRPQPSFPDMEMQ